MTNTIKKKKRRRTSNLTRKQDITYYKKVIHSVVALYRCHPNTLTEKLLQVKLSFVYDDIDNPLYERINRRRRKKVRLKKKIKRNRELLIKPNENVSIISTIAL